MDYLKIILKDLDQNSENVFYITNITNNIAVDWRSEVSRDRELCYQISFRDKTQNIVDDIYYFINDLFINGAISSDLSNIDSIIICLNETEYLIDGGEVFSIDTNNSSYGSQTSIVLRNLSINTNLPFVPEQQTPALQQQSGQSQLENFENNEES